MTPTMTFTWRGQTLEAEHDTKGRPALTLRDMITTLGLDRRHERTYRRRVRRDPSFKDCLDKIVQPGFPAKSSLSLTVPTGTRLFLLVVPPQEIRPDLCDDLVNYRLQVAGLIATADFAMMSPELARLIGAAATAERPTDAPTQMDAIHAQAQMNAIRQLEDREYTRPTLYRIEQGVLALTAAVAQLGLDASDAAIREKRMEANLDEVAQAHRSVRKHRREPRVATPPDIGLKFRSAVQKARQERFNFIGV